MNDVVAQVQPMQETVQVGRERFADHDETRCGFHQAAEFRIHREQTFAILIPLPAADVQEEAAPAVLEQAGREAAFAQHAAQDESG